MTSAACKCGHDVGEHGVTEVGCSGRCLCELCPDDTVNDCWCAGLKPVPVSGVEETMKS